MDISFVIPAYNEENGIVKTIENINYNYLKKNNHTYEIIVVDNNSKDNTAINAEKAGAKVIKETIQGYGAAYKAGFKEAKANIIITADADGTYPLNEIDILLDYFKSENLDFLTTNRFSKQLLKSMPIVNYVGNHILSFIFRVVTGAKITDTLSGMWIFKKDLLNTMDLKENGMGLTSEIKIKAYIVKNVNFGQKDISYYQRVGKKNLTL